ncbi:MAG: recombinase family protein [Candidatus Rokuibacteriota bacterium]
MLSVTAFADELEREKARQRTHDALLRKARDGYVPGGSVYGYDNVEVVVPDPATGKPKRLHVERRVNEVEAEIVRRIFELAAAGWGTRRIAHHLNDERVSAPPPRRDGRPQAWAPSTLYAMLTRPLYRGEVVWNRTRKRDTWGIKHQSAREEQEWVKFDAPDLRIVPEPLWQAVQARLNTSRQSYLRATNGQLWGRPGNGIESKYLLTGLAQCGVCGGSLVVHSRATGPGRKQAYTCSYYHLRGKTVCPTGILLSMEATNRSVLDTLEQEVLHPKVVEVGLRQGLELLRPAEESVVPRRDAVQAELAALDQELGRLSAAVAEGGDLPALLDAIKTREQRKRRLQEELAGPQNLERVAAADTSQLQRELEARLADWRGLLGRQVPVARQILKKLLVGRIVFRETDQGIEFTGQASLGRILAGIVDTKAGVAPTGFEPVFQP